MGILIWNLIFLQNPGENSTKARPIHTNTDSPSPLQAFWHATHSNTCWVGGRAGRMLCLLFYPHSLSLSLLSLCLHTGLKNDSKQDIPTECLKKNLGQVFLLDNCILISKSYYKGSFILIFILIISSCYCYYSSS